MFDAYLRQYGPPHNPWDGRVVSAYTTPTWPVLAALPGLCRLMNVHFALAVSPDTPGSPGIDVEGVKVGSKLRPSHMATSQGLEVHQLPFPPAFGMITFCPPTSPDSLYPGLPDQVCPDSLP